ncbi:hypothetical protein JOB18_046278 [Solea senegalensis]|uniref:Uncharacterized protein n=1 Tax=Solea senegalensis TaxID=28829 RepID=A0AAV6SNH2_SOLSE|nr:hypothetical protein JOB18_046278 [Solea senegalensis]
MFAALRRTRSHIICRVDNTNLESIITSVMNGLSLCTEKHRGHYSDTASIRYDKQQAIYSFLFFCNLTGIRVEPPHIISSDESRDMIPSVGRLCENVFHFPAHTV